MSRQYKWRLQAETVPALTIGARTFRNVVRVVHWRCLVADPDAGLSAELYGAQPVPPPTLAGGYIDLADLQAMPEADRRAAVIGWAERIRPGFVAEIEARAAGELDRAGPAANVVEIL